VQNLLTYRVQSLGDNKACFTSQHHVLVR
jgi:hypothetical protein